MKTIDDLRVSGQRVLLRLDLNVPLKGGHITDDGKIEACLPTINALLNRGAAVVVCSHLGRPGGAPPCHTWAKGPPKADLWHLSGLPLAKLSPGRYPGNLPLAVA
jgi:phosphoglycerate kinase